MAKKKSYLTALGAMLVLSALGACCEVGVRGRTDVHNTMRNQPLLTERAFSLRRIFQCIDGTVILCEDHVETGEALLKLFTTVPGEPIELTREAFVWIVQDIEDLN